MLNSEWETLLIEFKLKLIRLHFTVPIRVHFAVTTLSHGFQFFIFSTTFFI